LKAARGVLQFDYYFALLHESGSQELMALQSWQMLK
jgi:hypothetical protein